MAKIAILTPYSNPIVGGISSFVNGLQRMLRSRSHEVAVLSGDGEGDTGSHSNLGIGAEYQNRASACLSAISPDVIHCNAHRSVLAAGVRYHRSHPGTRLIFSFHTTPRIRVGILLRSLLASADVVTFVSEAQKEALKAKLRLRGDLRLLRPAVEISSIDRNAAIDWVRGRGIHGGFPTLSFMGPLEYPKKVQGVIDLVASLSIVRTKFPSAQLLVVGDGSLRQTVADAAASRGVPVLITGFVDRPEFLLAATDLYCHVSYQEGLPLALLEAMAAGCSVIASKTGGIPEVLDGKNGILVDPGPKAIAEAILDLAADAGARERMGRAAVETIRSSFSWGSRAPELYAIYGIGG